MSASFLSRRPAESGRTRHHRAQGARRVAGVCSILVASACAGATSRTAPSRPAAVPPSTPVVSDTGEVGPCTAAYGPGGAGLRISVESPTAGDLVVGVTAAWTVFRENDPTFDHAATVEFPTSPGAAVTVTLTADGVTRPCVVTEVTSPPPVLTAGRSGAPRLLFVGDSLTAQAATAITDSFSHTGAVTMVAGMSGSGLLSGYDWLPPAAALVRALQPTFAVAEFIGNYPAPGVPGASGAPMVAGSDEFVAAWAQRAATLTEELQSTGADVAWVISPPMASASIDTVADRLSAAYSLLASRVTGGHTIDEQAPFADDQSNFTANDAQQGHGLIVRAADGVHLTDAGCQLWARVMARALQALGVA